MNKGTIIYISGEGHSGSTLLDIILGSQEKAFSTGELIYLAQKGMLNEEYCACGNSVPECSIWSKIIKEWNSVRKLHLDEYIQIQNKLTSKKNVVSSYLALRNPSGKISQFLEDTEKLYSIIFERTDSEIIIDSSKAPGRLLILKKLGFNIIVIHLIRRFGDVLNSNKKKAQKNLKAGIEYDIKPKRSSYVFFSWILKNIFTLLFSKRISYKRVKYEEIVTNPVKELSKLTNGDLNLAKKLEQRGPFYPMHLVAGNKIRMQDHLFIAEKPMNTSYSRLNGKDKIFAKIIDLFY